MRLQISSLIFILFFISCSEKQQDYTIINVNPNTHDIIKASSFIEEYHILKLETNTESLINSPLKLQYYYDNIYILDNYQNVIFIFDKFGRFIKKLSQQGSGPTEYFQINDFCIENKLLYILDNSQRKILCFDNELNFIYAYEIDDFAQKIIVTPNDFWLYNIPSFKKEDYLFCKINIINKNATKYLSKNTTRESYSWSGVNVFNFYNQDICLSPVHSNTIYKATNDGIEMLYKINFGKKSFPESDNTNHYDIFDENFPYALKQNFYISDSFLIFDYFFNLKRKYCVYNKKNSIALNGTVENDLIKDFRFLPIYGNNNYLIETINPEDIYNYFPFLLKNKELANLKIDDNPVLIFYRIKNSKENYDNKFNL